MKQATLVLLLGLGSMLPLTCSKSKVNKEKKQSFQPKEVIQQNPVTLGGPVNAFRMAQQGKA